MRAGRVILIPGAFNPPTEAHVKMGIELHKKYPASKIVYVPCNDNYLVEWKKQKNFISMEDRVRLLYGCIDLSYAYVSIFESDKQPYGYLIDTARHFKNLYDDVIICIGSDNLAHLDQWKDAETLVKENQFICFDRNPHIPIKYCQLAADNKGCNGHINILSNESFYNGLSSTMIRNAYIKGDWDTVFRYVPENVFLYLRYNDNLFQ